MTGFLTGAARLGGKALLGGIGGAGIGFTSDLFDGEDDFSLSEMGRDAAIGALGFGLGSSGVRGGAAALKRAPLLRNSDGFASKLDSLLSGKSGFMLKQALPKGGAGLLTLGLHGMGDKSDDVVKAAQAAAAPSLGLPGGVGGSDRGLIGSDLNGVFALGGAPDPGEQPIFSKTFEDYLRDKELNRLADAQIIGANKALGRENEDTRLQLTRNVTQNTTSQAALQEEMARLKAADAKAAAASNEQLAQLHGESANRSNRILEDLGVGMQGGEGVATANAAMQNRIHESQDADKDYLEALSGGASNLLGNMAGASAMQGEEAERMMRRDANDVIAKNRAQASDNWLKRPEILGQYADSALQSDLQRHQLGLQAYGQRLDALNAYRNSQYQFGQLGLQIQEANAPAKMDPAMLNAIMGMGSGETGNTFNYVDKDTGQTMQHSQQRNETWDPQLRDYFNQLIASQMGLPAGFTTFAEQPVPEGAKKQGNWYDFLPGLG